MLTINNKQLRNLEEQVQKNKEDIAAHYEIDRALANFGIKIVGTVATPQELPDPLTYQGEYGDGYAVGEPGSYVYYIYTRPDPNAGRPDNHWLDVGSISVVGPRGPEGPQGPQGDQGVRGTRVWTAITPPTTGIVDKDLFLPTQTTVNFVYGNLYQYNDSSKQWTIYGSIQGPQGVQGPQGLTGPRGEQGPQGQKGDRGDVGGLVNIVGKLDNPDQLPTPQSINNPTYAYLVGVNNELYIQVGATPATSVWQNMGQLNVGTYVTSGGQYQNIWDADKKVSVDVPEAYSYSRSLYGRASNGSIYRYLTVNSDSQFHTNFPQKIPQYTTAGTLATKNPTNAYDCVNKQYLEGELEIVNTTVNYLSQQLLGMPVYGFCNVLLTNRTEHLEIQFVSTLPYVGGLPTDIPTILQSLKSAGSTQPIAIKLTNVTPNYNNDIRNSFEGNAQISYTPRTQSGTITYSYYDNSGDISHGTINLNDVINWTSPWELSVNPISSI